MNENLSRNDDREAADQWVPPQVPAPPIPPAPQKSWFARHKIITGLLAVVVVAVVGSAMNGGAGGGGGGPAAEEPPAAAVAKVGSKVRDGKFEFTVTKVDQGVAKVGEDVLSEKAQGQFVLVHVTVENVGTEPQTLIDSEQKLKDTKGREFSTDTGAALVIKGNDVFFTEINPGNSVKGVLVYDMPKGTKPASVELHDSMFSDGVTVTLG